MWNVSNRQHRKTCDKGPTRDRTLFIFLSILVCCTPFAPHISFPANLMVTWWFPTKELCECICIWFSPFVHFIHLENNISSPFIADRRYDFLPVRVLGTMCVAWSRIQKEPNSHYTRVVSFLVAGHDSSLSDYSEWLTCLEKNRILFAIFPFPCRWWDWLFISCLLELTYQSRIVVQKNRFLVALFFAFWWWIFSFEVCRFWSAHNSKQAT